MAPESFPKNRWHWENSAGNSAMVVFPVRSSGFRIIFAVMASETPASAAVPNKMTSASLRA
jgi:hypothetical protein